MPYLILITLIGGLIRFYALTEQSYWIDEIYIADIIKEFSREKITYIWYNENHPPLYLFALKMWAIIFGQSEWSLRAFSALLGTLTIPIVFSLSKLVSNKKTALICALIVSFSPLMIYYSQEVRYFSLWIPLSGLSFIFFLQWVNEEKNRYLIWAVITSLALLTHIYSLFILFIQGIYFLTFKPTQKLPRQFYWSLAILGMSLSLISWWIVIHLGKSAGFPKPFSLAYYPYIIFTYVLGFSYGSSIREIRLTPIFEIIKDQLLISGIPLLIIITILLFGIAGVWKDKKNRVLFSLVVLTTLLISITPLVTKISFNIRSTLFLAPFYYHLLSVGVENMLQRRYLKAFPSIIGVVMVISLYQYFSDPTYFKDDLRNTVKVIRSNPDTPVLTTPALGRNFLKFYQLDPLQRVENLNPYNVQDYEQYKSIYVLWNREWTLQNLNAYKNHFNNHYEVIEEHHFPGVIVQRLKRN